MKKLLRVILIVVLVLAVAFGGFVGWLSVTEYRPAPVAELSFTTEEADAEPPAAGQPLRILSWNIGYAALGKESDFFMDGGKDVRPSDAATVQRYLSGIDDTIRAGDYDLVLLQEVDTDSRRSYGIDETAVLAGGTSVHALNYSTPFVPVPFPPLGKVHSGLFTISDYPVTKAERVALPCPFSWPMRTVNLKRCLLVTYLPLRDSDRQLVLVNLHLEAYDDGEGKIAQTNQLREFITAEYGKGNYVIAGGDFNQSFPGALEAYPMLDASLWTPGTLTEDLLPEGWRFAYDTAVPSCRLLDRPYDPSDTAHTQHYVIDGFLLSPNVELEEVVTLDLGFENSDHNPVALRVTLK